MSKPQLRNFMSSASLARQLKKYKTPTPTPKTRRYSRSVNSKFTILNVKGDGNCLFRAIAQALNNVWNPNKLGKIEEEYYADFLRFAALNEICRKNGNTKPYKNAPFTYKQSIENELFFEYGYTKNDAFSKYCSCQKRRKGNCLPTKAFTWGGFHEITALSNYLQRKIVVYVVSNETYHKIPIKSYKTNSRMNELSILLVGDNHYKAILV